MSIKKRLSRLERPANDPLVRWLSKEMDRIADAAVEGRELEPQPMSWQEAELLKAWGLDA